MGTWRETSSWRGVVQRKKETRRIRGTSPPVRSREYPTSFRVSVLQYCIIVSHDRRVRKL